MVGEHIWLVSTLISWPERVYELFMNNILYFYELFKISIWQHWPSALGPVALGLWAYISGKSLVPMLQLLHVQYFYITLLCNYSQV